MRSLLLAVVVAYALASIVTAAATVWGSQGTFGFDADFGGVVRDVLPGGPADRAGIEPGDRIDLAATPPADRGLVIGVGCAVPAGTAGHFVIERAGTRRTHELVAMPIQPADADRFSMLLTCLASLVFVVVGALLIVLRPSLATWGFGLYCLLDLPTAFYPFRLGGGANALALRSIYDVVQNVGVVGLPLFTLEFPHRTDAPLQRAVRRALPVIFVVLAVMTLVPDVWTIALGRGARVENDVLQIAFGLVFLLALGLLADTYRRTTDKERMRWVLAGFSVGLVIAQLGSTLIFSSLVPVAAPGWFANTLVSIAVLLPLAVAHAVIRHRVLDITFVASQTLVYAVLTTIIAGLFSALDWLFGNLLEEFRLSRLAQAATAIGVAFAFNAMHHRIEAIVEALFFKKRRDVEERLTRLTERLPFAESEDEIAAVLVGEVARLLDLVSAALYRRHDENFVRTAAIGYDAAPQATLDDADVLLLALRSEPACLRLADIASWKATFPDADHAALVAVPLFEQRELRGLALYGGHVNGADLDGDETQRLASLGRAAGSALERIAARELRVAHEHISNALRDMEARLDEARRAPSPSS